MWPAFVNLQIINILTRIVILLIAGVAGICPLRAGGTMVFTPNQGQWDSRINYQLEVPGGYMYLEKDGITVYLLERPHLHGDDHDHPIPQTINAHAFKSHFVNANPQSTYVNEHQSTFYYNYLLGNDPSKWKSFVYSYETVTYKEIYAGIDFKISTHNGETKSEYIVKPGANPNSILLNYEGVSKLRTEKGNLVIETSLGQIIEEKPVAWQIINGQKKMITCTYVVKKNDVSFALDKNYDSRYELVIDPVLMFATYVGSTADNFGCTATYDDAKNVYSGALVYPTGIYPTTFGAFQVLFNGSGPNARDMGISKFNPTGTALLYSTYLGGAEQEVPHSLVVNAQEELFILGTTSSLDYPTLPTGFDLSFNGGTPVSAASQGINFTGGCDIVVTRLNAAGSALLGSTYMGGSGNDGLNFSASLNYNYGDIIRGEIILDNIGNPIVTTTTGSTDFPVTPGSFQTAPAGGTEGCIFKFNPTLSTLAWSSYFGGSMDDASYGVQMDSNGNLFITGGTMSPNLAITPGSVGPVFNGGIDGFIAKINPNGNAIIGSTYLGTPQYDQSYLVQIDQFDAVYVFGQTLGNYPISAGVYSNPNSGQFLHKLNNNLTTSDWSTRIGRSAGVVDISPTAFLVNSCDQIYLCGWGGDVNHFQQAISSTTSGLPITPGAFQSTTDGSDFWLAILSPNATALVYGTFFGGATSKEHVDGGTSRFDKDGVVYQAVCAGCGGNDDFPTTPGAWSNTNPSPNCNIGVFKFNLDNVIADAAFQFATSNCQIPAVVDFINLSSGAATYEWDFGDGSPISTLAQPSHTYATHGTYQVSLIAADSNTCNGKDTFYLSIFIPQPLVVSVTPSDTICPGASTIIGAAGGNGATFVWTPPTGLSDSTSANPVATPAQSTTYMVVATDTNSCADTQFVYVHVHSTPAAAFINQFTPCSIPAVVNMVNGSSGTSTFTWYCGDGDSATTTDVQHSYTSAGTYTITIIAHDENGCGNNDTATATIFLPPPAQIIASGSDTVCYNEFGQLSVSGGISYVWSPPTGLTDPFSSNPMANNVGTISYSVAGTDSNGCIGYDSATLYVFPAYTIDAGNDLIYDFVTGSPVFSPNVPDSGTFYWTPSTGLSCITCLNPEATPDFTTTYHLIYTDQYGCMYDDSMTVYVSPSLFIPNAFTANTDGTNDFFQIFARNLSYFEVQIFNRWGQLIYESTDHMATWNGTYKGIKCPEGVYVWKVTYADQIMPDARQIKFGHVTLIR